MALSNPTELWESGYYVNNTTITTTSISPTANALLIAIVAWRDSTANDSSGISDTFSGTGSWTAGADLTWNYSGGNYEGVQIYTAQAGSSPGSGTVTHTFTADCPRKHMAVYEVTGHDTGTPTGASGTNNNSSSATLTVTLSATPATDSLVIAGVVVTKASDTDIGAGTGFTELAERWSGGIGGDIDSEYMYDKDSSDNTADWSNLGASNYNVGAALEIKAAGAAALSITISDTSAYQYTGVRVVS